MRISYQLPHARKAKFNKITYMNSPATTFSAIVTQTSKSTATAAQRWLNNFCKAVMQLSSCTAKPPQEKLTLC